MKKLVLVCRKCKRMVDFQLTGRKTRDGKIVETYVSPIKCECGQKVTDKTCSLMEAGEA